MEAYPKAKDMKRKERKKARKRIFKANSLFTNTQRAKRKEEKKAEKVAIDAMDKSAMGHNVK